MYSCDNFAKQQKLSTLKTNIFHFFTVCILLKHWLSIDLSI